MIKTLLNNPLPVRWQKLAADFGASGACYKDTKTGMSIIETTAEQDGKEWHHLSMAFSDRLPTYDEMKLVKAVFIGPAYRSLQIFAEDSKHISIHDYCLHLWTCLEDDGLPDFGKEGTI